MMALFIRSFVLAAALAFAPTLKAGAPVILVVGDSLSAAYGISQSDGWVAQMQARLADGGYPHRVVNASISGETSAGGLARLPNLLDRHSPTLVLVELGGNDGLRGQPVAKLKDNLTAMVRLSRDADAQAVLFEMRIPENYGATYTRAFTAAFRELGKAEDTPVVPFFLAAIAEDESWFQADGIHPTAQAQGLMLDAVWPTLEPLLTASTAAAMP